MNNFSDIYTKYMHENKKISILNIISIIVSVGLLTLVFNFSIILRDYLKYEYSVLYTNSDISIDNVNSDFFDRVMLNNKVNGGIAVKKSHLVEEITYNRKSYDLNRFSENYTEAKKYYGDVERLVSATLVKGVFPRNNSELVVNKNLLDRLNIKANIGDKIKLSYNTPEKKLEKYYIISGLVTVDNFYSKNLVGGFMTYLDIKNEGGFDTYFYLNKNVDKQKFLDKIIDDYSLDWAINNPQVNYIYSDYRPEKVSFLISLVFTIIIYILSFGGIYTVYSAIYKKRKDDYSLLFYVGATDSQIKKIIKREILLTSLIAIPIGQILGLSILKTVGFKQLREIYVMLDSSSFKMKIYTFPNLIISLLSFFMIYVATAIVQRSEDEYGERSEYMGDRLRKKIKRKKYRIYRLFFGFKAYLARKSSLINNSSILFQKISIVTAAFLITITSISISFVKEYMIDTNKAVNDIVATLAEDTFVTDDLKEKLSSNDKILNYSFYRDLPAAFDIDGSYLNDLFYLESNKKENVTTYYNQKVLVLDDEKFKEFFGGISNRSLVQFENSDRPYYYIDEGKSKVPYKPKVDKIGIGLSSKLYKSLEVIEKTPINKEEINITKPTMVVVFTEKQASRIFGSGLNELKTSLLINLKNSTDAESVLGFLEINKMISDYFLSDYNRTNRMFSLITKYSIMFSLSILILAIFNVTNAVISNIYSRKDEIKLLSNIGLTKKRT